MYCPEVIVINTDRILWIRHGYCDYKSRRAPLMERINIFRYELIIRGGKTGHLLRLNEDGRTWLKISNFIYKLRKH